jgi:hypothetical protein
MMVIAAVVAATFACFSMGRAQNAPPPEDDRRAADGSEQGKPPKRAAPDAKMRLEATFVKTMTQATLTGFVTRVHTGRTGPPSPDEYRVGKVTKIDDGHWKVDYYAGETDLLLDMPPLEVRWTGETPVIVFPGLKIKGMAGTYTGRLLIDGERYSGTWSDGKSEGHLFGTIVHDQPKADETET